MTRSLSVFLPLDSDTSPEVALERFVDDPGTWLPRPARSAGPERWRVALHGAGLTREVEVELGDTWRSGLVAWRGISWKPVGEPGDLLPVERLLPGFDGELGFVSRHGQLSLVLVGGYDAPAALLGAAADAVAFNRVARRTATRFLADIRGALSTAPADAPAL